MDFSRYSLGQIKELLAKRETISNRWLRALQEDSRPGVQKLGLHYARHAARVKREKARLEKLFLYEKECYGQGLELVAGVDEVGRGPLAGPVVACAVILPPGIKIPYLNDSKKVPPGRREELAGIIKSKAVAWSVGIARVKHIDDRNIYHASIRAMENAVNLLHPYPQHLLVDALRLPGVNCPQKAIIHGDALSASIAAASILAKVIRDTMMQKYEQIYPGYGFAGHKGYCTREHVEALKKLGPCPLHRRSFQIVRELCQEGGHRQETWEW